MKRRSADEFLAAKSRQRALRMWREFSAGRRRRRIERELANGTEIPEEEETGEEDSYEEISSEN